MPGELSLNQNFRLQLRPPPSGLYPPMSALRRPPSCLLAPDTCPPFLSSINHSIYHPEAGLILV